MASGKLRAAELLCNLGIGLNSLFVQGFSLTLRLCLTATDTSFSPEMLRSLFTCTGKPSKLYFHISIRAFLPLKKWYVLLLVCMNRKTVFTLLFCSLYNLPGSFSLSLTLSVQKIQATVLFPISKTYGPTAPCTISHFYQPLVSINYLLLKYPVCLLIAI